MIETQYTEDYTNNTSRVLQFKIGEAVSRR